MTVTSPHTGPPNLLLHAASAVRRPRLARLLQHVSFEGGHQFWSPDEPVPFALFPLRGIVSLEMPVAPNRLVEVGIVGREGFVGVPLFLGLEHALFVPMALTRGEAIIMPPEVFRAYLRNIAFKSAVERYVHQLIAMLAEISLCNRVHDIEKVWVGRLLLIQDRTQTDSFQISQEFFSRVLGVRRASLNQVAADLQSQGAIAYDRRGWLTIRDRRQLEDRACSCYHALKARFDPRMRKVVS